jgi:crotonobetainyl-CoA:carnitine CoA-transferase CaiB-like acyl-CoA transferase
MSDSKNDNKALHSLLPLGGWSKERLNELDITGPLDPVLPTPFRITETSTATHSVVGLAANDLWELRTGRRQRLSLNTRHATASLRSTSYITVENRPKHERSGVMGMFPAKDGRWYYVHANFPHHRAAALKVLGATEDREAVIKAIAQRDAQELEDAILAAGGAGGMVRTKAEWAQHPQSAAVASLPLMEIVKIGDAPAEKLPAGDRPLSGIKVLDLTRVVAGPVGMRTLAEHGADVLRITAAHLPHIGMQDFETGHGKLAANLDLRQPSDVETLKALAREADVFCQGYRPGTIASRGFSPEELAKLRPGIVAVSLSAFSHAGPWAGRRGFDTAVQAVSGIAWRQGELFPITRPGPEFYPVSAIDYLAGHILAIGTMLALKRRAEQGGSWLVRTSLAQVGKWLVDQGELPESQLQGIPAEFTPEELASWMTSSQSPAGLIRHFAPILRMSETQPRWDRPVVPLGHHQAAWPAKQG